MIGMIWSQDKHCAIGSKNEIPWSIGEDLSLFQSMTQGAAVVMGRKTWESIPQSRKPLKNRINIVLSHDKNYKAEGALIASSWEEAKKAVDSSGSMCWVIGGSDLYKEAMKDAQMLCVTTINVGIKDADTFAPQIPEEFEVVSKYPERGLVYMLDKTSENLYPCEFKLYLRKDRAEFLDSLDRKEKSNV